MPPIATYGSYAFYAPSAPRFPIAIFGIFFANWGAAGWAPGPGIVSVKACGPSPVFRLFSGPLKKRFQVVPEGSRVTPWSPLVPDLDQNGSQNGS